MNPTTKRTTTTGTTAAGAASSSMNTSTKTYHHHHHHNNSCSSSMIYDDIWQSSIFCFLDLQSLLQCEGVCRKWKTMLDTYPNHWNKLYIETYCSSSSSSSSSSSINSSSSSSTDTMGSTREMEERCSKQKKEHLFLLFQELSLSSQEFKAMLRERHTMKQQEPIFERLTHAYINTTSCESNGNNNAISVLQEVVNTSTRPGHLWWDFTDFIQTFETRTPIRPLLLSNILGTRAARNQNKTNTTTVPPPTTTTTTGTATATVPPPTTTTTTTTTTAVSYFEVRVIGGGSSIGLQHLDDNMRSMFGNSLRVHIGWIPTSYGYHSDDGNFYWNDESLINARRNARTRGQEVDDWDNELGYQHVPYGESFPAPTTTTTNNNNNNNHNHHHHNNNNNTNTNNNNNNNHNSSSSSSVVVGCGYHFHDGTIFFTKNGEFQGIVSTIRVQPNNYCAAIALHESNVKGQINFGSIPFLFNIEEYCCTIGNK